VRIDRDQRSANPADQATTARDRQLRSDWADTAAAEQTKSADDAAARSAMRAADAASVVTVNRQRASYLADHPQATEVDFERDLLTLIVVNR
jgi:hypothetical protein